MKILFITDNFPPEVNAPASRTYDHCKRWVEKGADVTVITCAPNFPQGKVYEGYKNRLYHTEEIDGIKVIRVWSYISANEGFIKRIIDYTSFAFMAFWAGLFKPCDIIIATSPQFFTTFTGWALSKLKRRPWIFELRDLWPESIITVGAMKKSKAIKIFEKIEHFMYRSADMIIPVTNAFKKHLISRNITEDKIHVITNGVDPTLFSLKEKNNALINELGLGDKFIFGYIGTHGMAHSLDFIINSLQKVKNSEMHFLFIGGGAMKRIIVEQAEKLNLKNVSFLPSVSKSEVSDYVGICDVVLVPLKKSDTFKTVIPSKIFESAAMQKPMLLGVDGQAREIIEAYNAGLYFEPENEDAFLKAVKTIKQDKKLYSKLQLGGKALAQNYDRNTLADKMLDHLQKLIC
ncbi:glycosyltransferase family 4 protein [Emcibacteraceae bacterium]|nr:glycosyltransferase family 4 protein [Emcibacteraceae bacterium]